MRTPWWLSSISACPSILPGSFRLLPCLFCHLPFFLLLDVLRAGIFLDVGQRLDLFPDALMHQLDGLGSVDGDDALDTWASWS